MATAATTVNNLPMSCSDHRASAVPFGLGAQRSILVKPVKTRGPRWRGVRLGETVHDGVSARASDVADHAFARAMDRLNMCVGDELLSLAVGTPDEEHGSIVRLLRRNEKRRFMS